MLRERAPTQADLFEAERLPDYLRLETILVIEDHADLSDALRLRLEAAGYEAHVAADGLEGLRAIRELDPDLVVLDLELPGQSGFKLLHELRRLPEPSPVPVIILTGSRRSDLEHRARTNGVRAVFHKPTPLGRLVSRIRGILDGLA